MATRQQFSKTAEQIAICESDHKHLIIEANAGAAKTTTAVMKFERLIANGADPSKIVALAFSESGVTAYKNAFRTVGIPAGISNLIQVGTVEEFCAARLKELEAIDVVRLVRPEDVRTFVLKAIQSARIWARTKFDIPLSIEGTGEFAVEGLLKEFDLIKGSRLLERQDEYFTISPDGADSIDRSFTTLAIFKAYERMRTHFFDDGGEHPKYRFAGDATYDLANIVVALDPCYTYETNPLRMNLQAVVLDEMHDTNWAMFTVLKELLDLNEGALFLGVGDSDQVVHDEQGAESYFMNEGFDTHIVVPQRLNLSKSFRFGRDVSGPLGSHSGKTYMSSEERSTEVNIEHAVDAAQLMGLINQVSTKYPRTPKSQIAVLLRHPKAAADLEHALRSKGIAYEAVGFTTYLERPEVLYVRTLLGLAVSLEDTFRPEIAASAKRATWEFITATSQLSEEARLKNASDVEGMKFELFLEYGLQHALGMRSAKGLLAGAVDESTRSRLRKAVELAVTDDINCLPAVIELLDIGGKARRVFVIEMEARYARDSVNALAKASQNYGSISQFLSSLLKHDYAAKSKVRSDDRIVLSSIEESKGLEFDHVIIPNVNPTDFDGKGRNERNLFYVAASRVRDSLTLTHSSKEPSSFLLHFEKNFKEYRSEQLTQPRQRM
jgi:DNA helicase-2/ATP-dependent DNA helicase PcrA